MFKYKISLLILLSALLLNCNSNETETKTKDNKFAVSKTEKIEELVYITHNTNKKLIVKEKLFYELSTSQPFTGKASSKYTNGNKRVEIECDYGSITRMTEWYLNGKKKKFFNDYGNDTIKTEWYENGNKKISYRSEKQVPYDYIVQEWYEDGSKKSYSSNNASVKFDKNGKAIGGTGFKDFVRAGHVVVSVN